MPRTHKPASSNAKHPARRARRALVMPLHPHGPHRFPRGAWGDQSLEERIPTFLEALLFEPEPGPGSHRG